MPILVDFSGTVHAGVHVDIRNHGESSKEFLRHIILNQIRAIRKKFHNDFGELVICMDSKVGYWRRDIFPYYKAKRKAARDASGIDWGTVFGYVNEIAQEIAKHLPYKVISVPKAEADDIIGTLAVRQPWKGSSLFEDEGEPVLIVSNDHDFKQLHDVKEVKQYFPFSGGFLKLTDAELFKLEHILKGDAGDGIPNVRSAADTFMQEGVRQKPVTAKYIREFKETGTLPEEDWKRYKENEQLIDLRKIPEDIQSAILEAYEAAPSGNRFRLWPYFTQMGLKEQLDRIGDF